VAIFVVTDICHDLAKWLSHYLYLYSFLFLLDLLHRKECGKVSRCYAAREFSVEM